ncbi:phage holin family protein [Nocardioides anomalus]|uniref:Phage holin family protein n=1 Tax=Nocardioides anomalus TaxID=2712223 RepID=A0A6G6WGP2_9ACTN|nr:phage holin family protein [Nocardioides anomalus]QIG44379.1 phage holin family protein [Nocardioides anomalus]
MTTQPHADEPIGATVHRLSEQLPDLVRSELRLAQAELAEKGKHAGVGIGLFSGAGVLALYGLTGLLTTAVIALDLVLPLWLAALIVTVVLFVAAGVAALVGKKQVTQATPAAPERAIAGVKEDVQAVKGNR